MKIAIVDELHDIKRSGVYYSTEALRKMYRENEINCDIVGIKKRGQIFNWLICVPFLRELFIFPVWNLFLASRLSALGYDVVFYQCSTALLLLRKTSFKRVLYTRALLTRRLSIYKDLALPQHQKLIIRLIYPFIWLAERYSFRHSDRIVASKERFAQYLQKVFGIEAHKFKVVPQMIDLFVDKRKVEKKYDLLFIGRLSAPKNWPLIVDIARTSNLKIAAATPELQQPEDTPDNIKIFCRVPYKELSKLIYSSRIFIMPSFNEEGPRVTLEAMACGLPVVASTEGSGEFIQDGINGLEIKTNNTSDYQAAINKIINNKELYKKMRLANPKKAEEYTPERLGEKYVEALRF